MQKWEYTTLVAITDYDIDQVGIVALVNNRVIENWSNKQWSINSALQQLGGEGWELINMILISSPERSYKRIAYYFKRPASS